ncbi:hypothetical protein IKS57_00930 [bacterium]|nr:hypothetical protein [bacterium]
MKEKQQDIDRLKDLTFEMALKAGSQLENVINEKEDINKLNAINQQLEEGIKLNMLTYQLRQIIMKINNDDVKDCAIPDDSTYRYYYYMSLLANVTENEPFKKFIEQLKKEALINEKKNN